MREVKQIGNLIQDLQTTRGERDTQQLSTRLSTEQIEQIFRFYKPSNQFAIAEQGDRAFIGNSPTLATLKRDMGDQGLKGLIAMQVMDLDDEVDVKDKLGGEKAAKLADKIYSVAFYLKASELLVFFWRFKCGMYGKFYGVVDSLKIMESLHEFIKWRNEKLAAIERKAKRERELADPEQIALDKWVKDWHQRLKDAVTRQDNITKQK